MARTSSTDLAELVVPASALDKKWQILGSGLRAQLGFSVAELNVEADHVSDIVTAGFVGRACEYTERAKGKKSWVAPFLEVRNSFKAWLGYQEVWENKPYKRSAFRHVSLTVFLGHEGDTAKAQIFRSEWPGIRAWTSGGIGFQAPGAGQPHWQLDVLKTLRDHDLRDRDRSLARLKGTPHLQEFDPNDASQKLLEKVRQATLERMHFASAAPWWVKQPQGAQPSHMNAPHDPEDLLRWTLCCVSYIRQEMQRF